MNNYITKNKSSFKEPHVVSLGCRLNYYESQVMLKHAKNNRLENTVIVNTCAVTSEAERQSKQTIRKIHKDNPGKKIIATGCAVQINPEKFSNMIEVDQTIGNEQKLNENIFLKDKISKTKISDIMLVKETVNYPVTSFNGRTIAYAQIQQGCNHRCTFCIIPFARGNNRSVPMGVLFNQIRKMVMSGYQEVVLTGVDISSYGNDLPNSPTLGKMIKRLLKAIPEIKRLRLSSLDPANLDKNLIKAIGEEERLMPHFHLSSQSGDNVILKRMKRRHSREDIIEITRQIRNIRPNSTFGSDLIAGFPTEEESNFKNTIDLIHEANLSHLHVFPFSIRKGTPAERMPQVNKLEIKNRAKKLRLVGDKVINELLKSYIGKEISVLVEKNGKGKSQNYLPIKILPAPKQGSIINVTAKEINEGILIAS